MSCESEEERFSGDAQFVRRLFALPIMADAFNQLNSLYCGTKERNRLLKMTIEKAESGVGAIVSTAQPMVSRFDKQILMLDNIACAQLDRLQKGYPVITKPTEEVVKETKELCTGAVQPVVNYVHSVKDYGYNKVSGIRMYTGEKIDGIRRYSADTVAAATRAGTDQVARVLSTPVCRSVLNRFDAALGVADRYVDNYLPEQGEEVASKKKLEADIVVLSKALQLSTKVQRRIQSRAMKRLENIQLQAKETIAKLSLVLNWIELTKSNMTGAKERAWHIWQEIMKMEGQVVEETTKEDRAYYDSTFDRKAIATARQLMIKLKSIVSWIDESAPVSSVRAIPGTVNEKLHASVLLVQALPNTVRERVEALRRSVHSLSDTFSKEMVSVKDIPHSVLENARNALHQLYDSVSDLVDWTIQNTAGSQKVEQFFRQSKLYALYAKSNTSEESETDSKDRENSETEDQEKEDCESETRNKDETGKNQASDNDDEEQVNEKEKPDEKETNEEEEHLNIDNESETNIDEQTAEHDDQSLNEEEVKGDHNYE